MKLHPDTVFANIATPLGSMLAAASPQGLCGLWFDAQKHHPFKEIPPLSNQNKHPMLQKTKQWLDAYFSETNAKSLMPQAYGLQFDLSSGTPFQQAVWQRLLHIAPGKLDGYGAIATELGNPKASRAVGAAVGKNPIAIILPCHRVVGASGALTGYAGGMDRKVWLLQHEGALI